MQCDITIVGLGPGDPELITRAAWATLQDAERVYLRTRRHPCVAALPPGPSYHSFDALYEQHTSFDELYADIAQQVVALGHQEGGVVYAVPGDPGMGEATVGLIVAEAEAQGLRTRLLAGVSFLEPTCHALGCDPFDGLQICDATSLARRCHPPLDPDVPALVVQVYNRQMAAECKLTLTNLYPDEHPVHLVCHAGLDDQQVREMPLYELDRQEDLDHLSSVYLPALPAPGSLSSYQDVMARLRAPDGCPWDREQTHESLRGSLLEETYEVLEALDSGDMGALCEELGDLLLQVLFHGQIATENGDFRLVDSMAYAIQKLVRRHPHVFADVEAEDAQAVLLNWEQIKRQERGEQGDEFRSMLASISAALPALAQAEAIQLRVARVGFDWPTVDGVVAKLKEEMDEFANAPDGPGQAAELGDVLFTLVNLARWHGIDPESALREANLRFRRRFGRMEAEAHRRGTPLEELSPEELDQLWEQAKGAEEADTGAG
jgi:tetrapyrrole methylase family protein / MazG family protein